MEFDRVKFAGLRVTRGLSQDALAKQVGVSRPTVAGWEDGSVVPKLNHINETARILEVKPEDLILVTREELS